MGSPYPVLPHDSPARRRADAEDGLRPPRVHDYPQGEYSIAMHRYQTARGSRLLFEAIMREGLAA